MVKRAKDLKCDKNADNDLKVIFPKENSTTLTWKDARAFCLERGSDLLDREIPCQYRSQFGVHNATVKVSPGHLFPMSSKDVVDVTLRCDVTAVMDGEEIRLTPQKHGIRYAWTKDGIYLDDEANVISPLNVHLKSRPMQLYRGQGTYDCQVLIPGMISWITSPSVTYIKTFIVTLKNYIHYEETVNGLSTVGYQKFVDDVVSSFVSTWVRNFPEVGSVVRLLFYVDLKANSTKNIFSDKDNFIKNFRTNLTSAVGEVKKRTSSSVSLVINETENFEFYKRQCRLDFNSGPYWEEYVEDECPRKSTFLRFQSYMNLETSWVSMKKKDGVYRYSKNGIPNLSLNWVIGSSSNGDEECAIDNGTLTWNGGNSPLLNVFSAECSDKHTFLCYTPKYIANIFRVDLGNREFDVNIYWRKAYESFEHEELTWSQADKQCFLNGGSLLNFDDENMVSNEKKIGPIWIGLRKLENGTYMWTNGKNLTYELWNMKTDFTTGFRYVYAAVTYGSNYNWDIQWSLGSVDQKKGYICEYDFNSLANIEELDEEEIIDRKESAGRRTYNLPYTKSMLINVQITQAEVKLECSTGGSERASQTDRDKQRKCSQGEFDIKSLKENFQKGLVPSSVVFYKDGFPLRFIQTKLFLDLNSMDEFRQFLGVNFVESSFLQGYYWCEGISFFSQKIVTSQKLLVVNPRDITLVCQLTISDVYKVYKEGEEIPKFEEYYYNFLKNYTAEVQRNLYLLPEIEKTLSSNFRRIVVQVTKFRPSENNQVILYFNIYINEPMPSRKRRAKPSFTENDSREDSRLRNRIEEIGINQQDEWNLNYKEIILKALRLRAESPKQYDDPVAAWLDERKVSPRSIIIRDSNTCREDETENEAVEDGKLNWPSTPIGSVTRPIQLCSTREGDPVIRRCIGNFTTGAYWSAVIGRCDGQPSNITLKLKLLSESDDSSKELSENLTNLTSQTSKLQAVDIGYIADVVDHISEDSQTIQQNVVINIIESVDNVLTINETSLMTSQNLLNTSMRLINSLDDVLNKVELNEENNSKIRIERPKLAVEVWSLKKNSPDHVVGIADVTTTQEGTDEIIHLKTLMNSSELNYNNTDAAIILPSTLFDDQFKNLDVVENRNKEGGLRLSFIVYKSGKFFIPQSHEDHIIEKHSNTDGNSNELFSSKLNTAVISASVKGQHIENLFPPLKLIFNPRDLYGQDNTELTEKHKLILEVITYVGCSLSIIGLILTILTYILFRKWRKSLTNQIHVNLALALLLSILVFVLGTERTWHSHEESCIAVAALLHYFLLSSFLWMLVEAVKHYLLFVAYMKSYVPSFMKKSMVVSWGTPLLIVVITLAVDHDNYNGGQYYCWMALKGFYFSFLLPMGIIMLTNVALFLRITYALAFDKQRKNMKLRTNQPENKDDRIRFYAAVGIFILSGVTWTFAFFAVSDARLPFQYLFCIFNSLQGFFIFFLMIIKRKGARNYWERTLQKCFKKKYEEGSGPYSSSGTPMRSGYSNENKTGITHIGTSNGGIGQNGVKFSRRTNAVKVLPS
ncbi:Adhesion G-protein coupled receptor G6 [Nymphon striatum]|nr:Adhesion G-protein coupled receptor G6 [Nymphon striatum]